MGEVILHDAACGGWLAFGPPRHVVTAASVEQVLPALREAEQLVQRRGWTAAGFVSYEAAPAFDSALATRPHTCLPLLWFGLYDAPQPVGPLPGGEDRCYELGAWQPSVSRHEYRQAISAIRRHLTDGDTYQVNYTFRLRSEFSGHALGLFRDLVQAQRAAYGAYVDTGRFVVCSASPELFFELNGDSVLSRPMKGTAARVGAFAEDEAQACWLRHSEKNRAENVMIVDMIRNDLGRVAQPGSVRVPRLFQVERYPTVWQMTSTVEAVTSAGLTDILRALFPCASVTGAPKPKTMQIIATLEPEPRQVYCGCIGFYTPDRRAQFNVAIRTVLIDRESGRAEYGVGGGIVWDSDSEDEYEECRTKARVLTERWPEFSLLETMLWSPESGVFLLDEHIVRALRSATYFGIPLSEEDVRRHVQGATRSLAARDHKVRLLVSATGDLSVEASPFDPDTACRPVRLRWAASPVDSHDRFLYHKTTHRHVYEQARSSRDDCDDVLLWNERGEVTESCIANLVLELDGRLVTPAVGSGLLAGTFRSSLLASREVEEAVVSVQDLLRSPRLFVVNSVRKWREAVLVDPVSGCPRPDPQTNP